MKRSGLVLFFTDAMYRKATLEHLKIKFLDLPIIRNIFYFVVSWRFVKKTENMDSWEQHLAFKKLEYETQEFVFCSCLVRLYAYIVSEGEYRNDADFLKCKQELLECKIIQEKDLQEFREYVQQLESNETDGTRIKAVFDSYSSKLQMAN